MIVGRKPETMLHLTDTDMYYSCNRHSPEIDFPHVATRNTSFSISMTGAPGRVLLRLPRALALEVAPDSGPLGVEPGNPAGLTKMLLESNHYPLVN
jgi:hypothetical protein